MEFKEQSPVSRFRLGTNSNAQLRTCRFDLQRLVERALELTDVDFSVVEGRRSEEQQRINIENGVSWTTARE